jgi:hypothetical protein
MQKRSPRPEALKQLIRCLIICLGLAVAHVNAVEATIDADSEKPQVTFKRDGNKVVASLIPRAKSTTVHIAFAASTGRLVEVSPTGS